MAEPLEQRFAWIEACLRYAGRFGIREKKAYRDRFGLTDSMVSRDQDRFRKLFNDRYGYVVIAKSAGRLEPVDGILPEEPVFQLPRMAQWLEDALGGRFETVPTIRRAEPPPVVLRPVVQAIGARRKLCFEYYSRKGGRSSRSVSPHTILEVAGRLHLRGWDHERSAVRDFVLSRMISVSFVEDARGYVGVEADPDWAEYEMLEVLLRPGESLAAVRPDYDLNDEGQVLRRARKAHRYYLLDDSERVSDDSIRSPVIVRALNRNER